MPLNIRTRKELDPFEPAFFVMCKELYAAGMRLEFGDQIPLHIDLFHLHTHFNNGVVGTKEELDSLKAPVNLYIEDPLQPIAMFVAKPNGEEQVEEFHPEIEDPDGNVFSMENAGLLKTKDDLIGYASQFQIELKKASNISMKKMLETLEVEAKKLELI